jgi:hypothetical protein
MEAASLSVERGEGDDREQLMGVAARVGLAGGGKKKGLTGGAHLTEREERIRYQLGWCEPKRKTHFYGDAIDTWARWAGEEGFGLRGREDSGAS